MGDFSGRIERGYSIGDEKKMSMLEKSINKQAVWINLLYWNDFTGEKNIEYDFCPHREYIVALSHKVKSFQ